MRKKVLFVFLFAICLSLGCGSNSRSYMDSVTESAISPSKDTNFADFSAEYATDYNQDYSELTSQEGTYENTNRKLIKTVNMDVETDKFDGLLATILSKINQYSGYTQEYNQYGQTNYRQASLTIRIPEKNLEDFLSFVEGESNITSKNESVEDITLQYVDLDSHKNALKTEESRLMELLEKAETVDDLIKIESRLSEVRYQINSMESQLRTFDNMIDFATIHLYIDEVVRYTPQEEISTWGRIKTGFIENLYDLGDNITDIFVWFVVYLPNIIITILIVMIILIITKKCKKRKKQIIVKANNEIQMHKEEKKNEVDCD